MPLTTTLPFRYLTPATISLVSGYYHSLFLRGRNDLALSIRRTCRKGTGPRKPADASRDPDFYQMPTLNPSAMATTQGSPDPVAPTQWTPEQQEESAFTMIDSMVSTNPQFQHPGDLQFISDLLDEEEENLRLIVDLFDSSTYYNIS